MSASSDLVTQEELNSLIGGKLFECFKEGKFLPHAKGMCVPYDAPGFKASTWDIFRHPNAFGSILRVGFTDNGKEGNPGAELKYVFVMEMK